MRKPIFILLTLCTFLFQNLKAQYAPQGFTYQCLVREANGDPLPNQTVKLLFSLKSGAANGPIVYGETHAASTNEFGLVNLIIGKGTPVQGAFNAINWGGGAKFVTVSLESSPGIFDELGTSEFQSVPYALYAASAPSSGGSADNWGSQSAATTPEIKGNGTQTNPLGIASQDALVGQVLKWNGTRWFPQDDIANSGSNGGTITQINTGTGLTGGPITTSGSIQLSNTGVTPGAYGSATEIPVITIDAQGRITNIWKVVPSPGTVGINGSAGITVQQTGTNFVITNTGDTNAADDITITSVANGDVTGVFSNLQLGNNTVTTAEIVDGAIRSSDLNNMNAQSGQVLKWNGTTWLPSTDEEGITSLDVSAGAGISVTGTAPNFTIINTGDTDATDDVRLTTPAGGDLAGPFSNLQIKASAVGTPDLAAGAVTNSKIADGAINAAKLAQMGAATGEILKWDGTSWVTSADDSGSIDLAAGAAINITNVNGIYTITNTGDPNPSDDLTDVSMAGGDISGVFSNLQIKVSTVGSAEIKNAGVENQDIQDGAISTDKISAEAVTEAKLAVLSVATEKIKNAAVTAEKLDQMSAATGQVLKWNGTKWAPAADLTGTGGGGTSNYAAGAGIDITGTAPNFVVTNTGDLDELDDLLKTTTFDGDVQGVYTDLQLKANTVTSAEIVDGSVAGADLANGAVLGSKINRMAATTGQVLKWSGTTWAPANDSLGMGGGTAANYSAGTGISITGTAPNFAIANTGDADNNPSNELQDLSLSSSNILSLSGSTSQVDLSALAGSGSSQWRATGNHIYSQATGNVLIGQTSSNSGRLQVRSVTDSDEALVLEINNPGSAKSALVSRTDGTGIAGFFTSTAGPAIVTGNGAVGIGVAAPTAQLHVLANQALPLLVEGKAPEMGFKRIGAPTGAYVTLENTDLKIRTVLDTVGISLIPNNKIALNANPKTGNVAIGGKSVRDYKFEVQHDDFGLSLFNIGNQHNWELWTSDDGRLVFFNDQLPAGVAAGVFAANGTYTSSDRRLKDDIQPVFGVLEKIKNIPTVSYRLVNAKERSLGFIAQDVQAEFPELVQTAPTRNGEGGYLAVNYGAMTAVALQAVREQQSEIEALKAENAALKSRMDSIVARLLKLEK